MSDEKKKTAIEAVGTTFGARPSLFPSVDLPEDEQREALVRVEEEMKNAPTTYEDPDEADWSPSTRDCVEEQRRWAARTPEEKVADDEAERAFMERLEKSESEVKSEPSGDAEVDWASSGSMDC